MFCKAKNYINCQLLVDEVEDVFAQLGEEKAEQQMGSTHIARAVSLMDEVSIC